MIQEKSKLTSKGQLTVPKAIRKALGVKEGDTLIFNVSNNGEVQVRPERGESRFAKYRGIGLGHIKTKPEMDDYLKTLRGRDKE
jgi:AbrB family looped-hinge helix DNA binding protein